MTKVKLFLDSGAFSAFVQKKQIDINEYIKFIEENINYIHLYANLDVIGDAEGSLKNQQIMEEANLAPLPCFHMGEPEYYLKHYIDNYDYIGLGGMVGGKSGSASSTRDKWLDLVFSKYICNNDGIPKTKVHGFGLTSLKLMLRYPWFSVDSTSWVLTSRMGSVFVPQFKGGNYIYDENSWKVTVSSRSPTKKDSGRHIETFTNAERKTILDYFSYKGYQLGRSEFKVEGKGYKLKEGERWFGSKKKNGSREVEVIIEVGLCNDYKQRDELNIIYFLDLEEHIPEWPWPFKLGKRARGFGL